MENPEVVRNLHDRCEQFNEMMSEAGVQVCETHPQTPIFAFRIPRLPGEINEDYRKRAYIIWHFLLTGGDGALPAKVFTNFFDMYGSGKTGEDGLPEIVFRMSLYSSMTEDDVNQIAGSVTALNAMMQGF